MIKKVKKKKTKKPTKAEEAFTKGHQKGLDEVLEFLTIMEHRYRMWSSANPGLITKMQDGVKGKIESVLTTRRAVEKLKLTKPNL